jgi:hypothetical protein
VLSTQLKSIGLKQEGLFWWLKSEVSQLYELHYRESCAFKVIPGQCVAVTPSDVHNIFYKNSISNYYVFTFDNKWRFRLKEHISTQTFNTSADAYSGLLILALKNKLIKEN